MSTTLELAPIQGAYAVPIARIEPNPFQPRTSFPAAELAELAQSVEQFGILQPVIVRRHPTRQGWFQLVSGERRWRAAEMVGLEDVPAMVRDYNDLEAAEVALQENIQRQSLTDMEEAMGVKTLLNLWEAQGIELSDRKMARKLSVSTTFVSNCWKMLALPANFREIAGRKRGVKSSLFAINDVADGRRQRLYLKMVEAGESFRAVTKAIERDNQEIALKKATTKAPDTQTQQRQEAVKEGTSSSMSRGLRITGGSSQAEARAEVTKHITELMQWLPLLSDKDFVECMKPFARRILSGDLTRD